MASDRASQPKRKSQPLLVDEAATAWWGPFIRMQIGLAGLGLALATATEFFYDNNWMLFLLDISSIACLATAVFSTHGIGGQIRYNHATTPGGTLKQSWSFFQPGLGGAVFVVVQGLAWTLFATVLVFQISYCVSAFLAMGPAGHRLQASLDTWIVQMPAVSVSGALGLLSEILMAASLLTFKEPIKSPRSTHKSAPPRITSPTSPPSGITVASFVDQELEDNQRTKGLTAILLRVRRIALMIVFYNIPNLLITGNIWLIMMSKCYPVAIGVMWSVIWLVYLPTFRGKPGITGRRSIHKDSSFYAFLTWMISDARKYFQFRLAKPSNMTLDPNQRYVIGYHPHGIIPLGSVWYHLTPEWESLFPGISPSTLVSGVVHTLPVIRDLTQWFRGAEVSRRGFRAALGRQGSVLLVPGGQLEMIDSSSYTSTTVIVTGHHGFIRLAMQMACECDTPLYLVPAFGFGEEDLLDNVPSPRELQRWFMKKLRANAMYFPYGAFNLPGIPRPACLSVCIGDPILVPPVPHPRAEQISVLHRRYFTALEDLFEANKAHCGHGRDTLVYDPPIDRLLVRDWDSAWNVVAEMQPDEKDVHKAKIAAKVDSATPGIDGEEIFMFCCFFTFVIVALAYSDCASVWTDGVASQHDPYLK
eukprot:CAMPEP_0197846304 /NCGR_PEP_ID=MMETSP1438-20131217/3064_1 /TAXON_ID=1461541 /ORGANISM="Pterosperma sp., Strain CCMP1384" /LENGTH=644 /DNA_ID=CAMNT_0043457895 /DNA_START=85 /DNA_END=2022 /DNA_ORIENTATION=+